MCKGGLRVQCSKRYCAFGTLDYPAGADWPPRQLENLTMRQYANASPRAVREANSTSPVNAWLEAYAAAVERRRLARVARLAPTVRRFSWEG